MASNAWSDYELREVAGSRGPVWEGVQMEIRLSKEVFTNGEPILACITIRNASYKVRATDWVPTKFTVMRGQERLLGEDEPKFGESFEQRLRHIRQGNSHFEPLLPGTQLQVIEDLTKTFELKATGTYSVQARRPVSAYNPAPNHVGYIRGTATNLVSGVVTFQVAQPEAPK
jgi:hypothetical protein